MKSDRLVKSSDIICINETHFSKTDQYESNMLILGEHMEIYHKDRVCTVEE